MFIDVIFLILIALACYKGYSKGFIVAIFSVLGFIVGLAAAMKLSTIMASKLAEHTDIGKWLPLVSFILVFVAVAFGVNIVGKIIQKTFETVMLGWANRIAGVLLYTMLYSIMLSVFLFYAIQLHFIKPDTITASFSYPFLEVLGPKVIGGFGAIIPWFKNMFGELEQFFGTFAKNQ